MTLSDDHKMKHLKSSLRDLRQIVERITVRHLAEPFVSFDGQRTTAEVRSFMDDKDFDIVGVRRNGVVAGYVNKTELEAGTLADHIVSFPTFLCLEESAPMLDAIGILRDPRKSHVFVLRRGHVWGIVTKGDLQKAPIRMWLFGVFSLLEMQFLRLIRGCYPDDSWQILISSGRLQNARCLFKKRRRGNEAIDLADCLQFADKRTIVLKNEQLRSALGLQSRDSGEKSLKQLEHLRDRLAHGQDIITGQWPLLANLATGAENLLSRAEKIDPECSG